VRRYHCSGQIFIGEERLKTLWTWAAVAELRDAAFPAIIVGPTPNQAASVQAVETLSEREGMSEQVEV
jgi:hypothetical protein